MYIKKESFLGIYPDDQIFVEYISESEFDIFFRHSGPTSVKVYRFEGPEQKLISSQSLTKKRTGRNLEMNLYTFLTGLMKKL